MNTEEEILYKEKQAAIALDTIKSYKELQKLLVWLGGRNVPTINFYDSAAANFTTNYINKFIKEAIVNAASEEIERLKKLII